MFAICRLRILSASEMGLLVETCADPGHRIGRHDWKHAVSDCDEVEKTAT